MELKPCPFCGHEARMEHDEEGRRPWFWRVECSNPDCGPYQHTEQEAADAWNRRQSKIFGGNVGSESSERPEDSATTFPKKWFDRAVIVENIVKPGDAMGSGK